MYTYTYLTVGRSLTLAVMSTASGWRFSTHCRMSHSSFLGPISAFFGLRPCLGGNSVGKILA